MKYPKKVLQEALRELETKISTAGYDAKNSIGLWEKDAKDIIKVLKLIESFKSLRDAFDPYWSIRR